MSDSEFSTRISFDVDQASVDRAKAAVTSLGGAFAKTAAEVERSKALESAAKDFIQIALSEKHAEEAAAQLNARLKEMGATDKEIEKVVKAFDREVAAIQRSEAALAKQEAAAARAFEKELAGIQRMEAAAAKKAAADAARTAAQIERAEAAAHAENKARDEVAAHLENDQRNALSLGSAASEAGPSLGSRISRAGSALRGLPSVQIPGTGIGTDAVGNITRLSGALIDVAGKSSLVTTATGLLTPALGAQAAATVAAAAPAAIFVAAFAAIGLAIKALVDSTSQNVEKINSFAASQRAISDKVAEGATSKDIEAENAKLDERRKREAQTLATLQQAYNQSQVELTQAAGGLAVLSNTARIFSGDEQALVDQIAASQKIINDTTAAYDSNAQALKTGEFAANDARVAEEELARTRSDAALRAADDAGKDLQAQQKALAASEEQNKARLKSIEDEEAVVQRQIDVLTASGDTSDSVTAKLEALRGQLGALGKESDFISGTALAVSRQRDAEKKAAKEAEEAAKKRQDDAKKALENIEKLNASYTLKQQDLARQSAEKLADIQRSAADKRSDTTLKFDRDLVNLTEKSNVERLDALQKSARAEYQATVDTNRKLEDLRNDAIESETEATDSRNFLQAAKIRKGLEKANEDALKDAARAAEDRALAVSQEEQDRLTQLDRARQERAQAYRQEQIDNQTNLNRQLRDARIAKDRQFNETQIAYNREIQAQQAFLTQMSANNAAYYAQQTSMAQAAANGGSTQAGISREASTTGIRISGAGQFSGSISGLRPIATNNNRAVTINIAAGATDRELTAATVRVLGEVGLT